jgi:hypothetical protein
MTRCADCDTVIVECLCPSESKVISYELCDACEEEHLVKGAEEALLQGKPTTCGAPTWGSGERQIPYPELSDDHLKNIIKDGYRNPHIVDEAYRRGTPCPERAIDKLDPMELVKESMMFLEACASCAIEGNVYGDMISRAYNENLGQFYFHLNQHLEDMAEQEREEDR